MTEIAGRVAVVTGAGSGIGRGLATALAAAGAAVVVADLDRERADAVVDEIARAGGTARAVACDVCERAAVRDLQRVASEAFGPVSLLFANAGATALARLTDMTDEDVDWILHVNLLGVVHCLQAFLPGMLAAGDGHVVATASLAGLVPAILPRHAPYAAAKLGVVAMMLNLRAELAEAGVGCTVLCPGGVTTRIGESPRYRPARFGGPTDARVTGGRERAALPRFEFRPPEEVAAMTLLAVRRDRPMVVTDPSQRQAFVDGYVDVVLAAFGDAEVFDAGGPANA